MPSPFEFVIIALIIVGIAFAIFRGGQSNPEGTGAIRKELGQLKNQLTGVSTSLGQVKQQVSSVNGKMEMLETKVTQIERESITAGDIAALKELIEAKHDARGHAMLSIQTDLQIIKEYLLKKGLGG